jgi:hypothetical protein
MLADTLLLVFGWVRRSGCNVYPVAGRYWRGSSQILQEDSEVVSYCVPQVEHIMRSNVSGMFAVQKLSLMINAMLSSRWLGEV